MLCMADLLPLFIVIVIRWLHGLMLMQTAHTAICRCEYMRIVHIVLCCCSTGAHLQPFPVKGS